MKVTEDMLLESGKLPAYAFPGGYPLVYYCRTSEEICADCAQYMLDTNSDGMGGSCALSDLEADIHEEGPPIECAAHLTSDCQKYIESAYGEVEAT